MRDWKKLRVFVQADALVMAFYRDSESWPSSRRYTLTQQLERSITSVASNIVEGCSRKTQREYLRFLEIAYGSASEAQYQLSIARRLGFSTNVESLEQEAQKLAKALNAMINAMPEE